MVARAAFAPFSPMPSDKKRIPDPKSLSTLPLQKIVYLLCNLLTLALGLWKCRAMGLLPTGTGDWLAFETRGQVSSLHRWVTYGRLTAMFIATRVYSAIAPRYRHYLIPVFSAHHSEDIFSYIFAFLDQGFSYAMRLYRMSRNHECDN